MAKTIRRMEHALDHAARGAEDTGRGATTQDARPREHLVLTAERDITLRCGSSSITLTAAGKIIIRGKYILSRSSGVHRIKGGAVQIN